MRLLSDIHPSYFIITRAFLPPLVHLVLFVPFVPFVLFVLSVLSVPSVLSVLFLDYPSPS